MPSRARCSCGAVQGAATGDALTPEMLSKYLQCDNVHEGVLEGRKGA